MRGGVVILAHARFSALELPAIAGLTERTEHCAVKFYSTADPRTAIRISGLHSSPKNARQLYTADPSRTSEPLLDERAEDVLPRIIAGDLNTSPWQATYLEWSQQAALSKLLNPELSTFLLGSSIDEILFARGHYIASTVLPPGGVLGDSVGMLGAEPSYPASVVEYPHVGDHAPVMKPLPCDAEEALRERRKIQVKHLNEEAWLAKDHEIGLSSERLLSAELLRQRKMDVGRCYARLMHAIQETF